MNYTDQWINLFTKALPSSTIVELPILSGSMYPFITPGDRVKIVYTIWEKCHIGDIIIFREYNKLTAHRLLFRFSMGKRSILYQKGDRNRKGSFIKSEQIVGKVITIIKPDNKHMDLLKNTKIKRTIAIKKLITALLLVLPRHGKDLIRWIRVPH